MTHDLDEHGKKLTDYPRPSVAVDTAVLTVDDGELCVLLVPGAGGQGRSLPGTFLHEGENLAGAVLRSLAQKAGVTGREPQQMHVFDDPRRDQRGWVLSVAHLDVVPVEKLADALSAGRAELARVGPGPGAHEPLPQLDYDHGAIVAKAVERLRAQYRENPDPWVLLPKPFTLRRLQLLHEAVAGELVRKDTFRRHMERCLVPTGEMSDGGRGRPSRLFRRR